MKLYEIVAEIENLFDEETGEIYDIEALEKLEMDRDEKMKNLIALYKKLKAEEDALKKEKLSLEKRQNSKKRSAEWILNYVDRCSNGKPFECIEGRLSYRPSRSTELINEDDFLNWDGRFIYGKTELKPDKDAIKRAIDSGETIPGWEVVDHINASIK